ncbi:MAG: glycine--tRNA ligase subunit beta [Pseudomonadota bacterium]|jgi:glycyl-tRNA synthetase beta chain
MVGEFPELQGLMGGYYAAAQGEHPAVATAIRDHYKPVGQGDDVPTDPVTVAVSLADKLDTILSFLSIGLVPSGSKDPFAIRRAMIGAEAILIGSGLRGSLTKIANQWLSFAFDQMSADFNSQDQENLSADQRNKQIIAVKRLIADNGLNMIASDIDEALKPKGGDRGRFRAWFDLAIIGKQQNFAPLFDLFRTFAADRLKVQQREAGVRHDLIDAVFALGGEDDLVRLLARVHALQAFVTTEDGANLLAGYKRAANILKKEAPSGSPANAGAQGLSGGELREGAGLDPRVREGTAEGEQVSLSYTPEPAETALMTALDSAEPRATAAIAREDFAAAMAALASLRAPIDAFFDSVIVNDADPAKRSHRLQLLERVRAAVHNVADFSKIEG